MVSPLQIWLGRLLAGAVLSGPPASESPVDGDTSASVAPSDASDAAEVNPVTAAPAEPRAFVKASPRCPKARAHCIEIFAHVVYAEGAPAESPAWLAHRVRQANRLFAVIDVAFTVAKAERIDAAHWHIDTRLHRDELGAEVFEPGRVHLFVVGQLDDVDVADTQIRGVHWRLRRDTAKRWVIMSKISGEMVLAHELGHFFSLPHSSYRVSVMNKRPREGPPWNERRFADPEVEIMRRARDEMLASGMLVAR